MHSFLFQLTEGLIYFDFDLFLGSYKLPKKEQAAQIRSIRSPG